MCPRRRLWLNNFSKLLYVASECRRGGASGQDLAGIRINHHKLLHLVRFPGTTGLSTSCHGTPEFRKPFDPRSKLHGGEGPKAGRELPVSIGVCVVCILCSLSICTSACKRSALILR
jgi:hypothetical protein